MTVTELKALTPEDLLERMEPLIGRYVRRAFIPGFDPEDVRQEICLTIWHCQQQYDPENKKGHQDRASSFMNFVIHAISNRLGNLDYYGRKQRYVTSALSCLTCGHEVYVYSRVKKCPECGNGQWGNVRTAPPRSTEALLEVSEFLVPVGETDEYHIETLDLIERLAAELPTEMRTSSVSLMREAAGLAAGSGKVMPIKLRRLLVDGLTKNPGILYR